MASRGSHIEAIRYRKGQNALCYLDRILSGYWESCY